MHCSLLRYERAFQILASPIYKSLSGKKIILECGLASLALPLDLLKRKHSQEYYEMKVRALWIFILRKPKGHFTKVYSMGCGLTNFPGIRLIGISCIHTVRTQLTSIRRIPMEICKYTPLNRVKFREMAFSLATIARITRETILIDRSFLSIICMNEKEMWLHANIISYPS